MKSVVGVDSVDVNLENGLAAVKMKPGNAATLRQLQSAITKNGFTMKESTATVAGRIVIEGGKPRLQVSGSNDVLDLMPVSDGKPTARSMQGKAVVVVGVIPEAPKGATPNAIRYRSVTEEPQK